MKRLLRSPFLALFLGLCAMLGLASFYGWVLYQPGWYRTAPWGHLLGLPLLATAAWFVTRAGRGVARWPRRVAAWVGFLAAAIATVTLWLFVFVGSRLPAQARPSITTAPDFVLPDDDGDMVRLAELRARGPVVVAFYRGSFDRWAYPMLLDLEFVRPRVEAAGGRIVAICGDPRDESRGLAAKLHLGYPILEDIDLGVTRGWQVFEDAGRTGRPAIFVIDRDGRVRWLHFPASLRELADPAEVVRRLEASR